MPLINLFFWLILLLSGFVIAALLAAQFRAEQQADRQLLQLELRRDIRHRSSHVHSFRPAGDLLPIKRLEPECAFLTVEYEQVTDSDKSAVSFGWPRSGQVKPEQTERPVHSAESERHNCA